MNRIRIPARRVATTLLLAATTTLAQGATLTARLTNVFGNFLVGAGPVGDSGSFSEFLTTPDLAYDQQAQDAGAVNGVLNGQPVQGSASFATQAEYVFSDAQIVGGGAAATTGETPFAYVSLGANAISAVRLDFQVPVLTHFVLTGAISSALGPNVGQATSLAQASVQLTGAGGSFWSTANGHQGAFASAGTLLPGNTYRFSANASTRINGDAQYSFNLVLTPVPEPAVWLLLALGGPVLLWRRQALSRPAESRP
jgi:hypothetical protein